MGHFWNAELATPKAEFSSEDRVYVNMEGGTATAAHTGVTDEGALVQWKCERRDAELSRAGEKEGARRQGAFGLRRAELRSRCQQ